MTNILLVEDEPLIAEEIRQTLHPAGYAVINAFNAAAADENAFVSGVNRLITHSHAAAVIMDINLAGRFDGVEIGKRVREKSNIPVIFLTGYSDAATLSRAIGTSPAGYLIKPISGRQLLAQIELTLRRDRQDEHLETQAGLWNLTFTGEDIGCTFGWLSRYRYLRHEIASFEEFTRIIHSDDRKALHSFFAECRTPEKTGAQIEYRLVNAEGHERWILTKILKIENGGESVRISAINFDISEQKKKEQQLQYRASHDSLTNLCNRAFFMTELQRHAAQQTQPASYAVLFADLDKFKPVNDELGHAAGDRLLIEVGQRFQAAVKKTDVVARFGGDEFVFLIKDLKHERDLSKICRRILKSLADPVQIGDRQVKIGCSIGVAANIPADKNPTRLLHDADVALYAAKKSNDIRFSIFEDNDRSRIHAQLMTAEALRTAVKQDQFIPHFHPVLRAIGRRRIAGLKIEAHWEHPVQGKIPVSEYREAAEETGLIVPITLKVLERVLENLRGSTATKENVMVFLRLNRRLLLLRDWPAMVSMASQQFTEAGLSLIPELDESALSRPQSPEIFKSLRAAGIRFCLHLGSLPASFQSLSAMPFDFISFGSRDAEEHRFNGFAAQMHDAGKILIIRSNGKSPANLLDFSNFYIAAREFSLSPARKKNSEHAADNI